MDMGEKDEFEPEKRNDDHHMDYHSPDISSDWRYGGANLTNTSMDLIPMGNPVGVCKGDVIGSSSCSSASMVDTFGSTLWNHQANSQTLGFCDINVQNSASTSNTPGIRKGSTVSPTSGIDRTLDMGWNLPSSMLKGGIFLPNTPGMLAHTLSQVPAGSTFIERAARFSFFSGNNFSDMVNPFTIPESMVHYPRGEGMMQGTHEIFMGTSFNSVSGGQSQKNELKVGKTCKDVSMPVGHGSTEGSPLKNEKSASLARSIDEVKEGVGGSGNESDEAEFSGGGGQGDLSMSDGAGGKRSPKGFGLKKRKRYGQDTDNNQATKAPEQPGEVANDTKEIQHKEDQNPTLATNKTSGKQGKQISQLTEPLKEDYIHVRARRGQATNSHSLAERVRREKISERMKFLQDLVPSCSKVTGKAVMLDEIINYVQSLQRQVEFLSMKLATVNPQLDFNSEGLLAKDILKSRAGPSSTLEFSQDMTVAYHPMLVSQPGLIQAGLPGMGTSSDVLRRPINSQMTPMTGGYKEHTQVHNVWDDELHSVFHTSFETDDLPNNQDVDESLPPSHMKIELNDFL